MSSREDENPASESPDSSPVSPTTREPDLLRTIGIGREFSKYMVTVCLGAIPVFLALLALVGFGDNEGLKSNPSWFFRLPLCS